MDLFEFILTITSVIYALAVAQILSGISRIAQAKTTIKTFLPHSIWVFNLFVFIFLVWWVSWEFRDTQWTFPQYAYMLIVPTLIYFSCSLLVPQHLDEEEVSMEEHFFRIRKPLFASYFFAGLAGIFDGNLLADEPLWHKGRIWHIAILGLAMWAFFSSNRNTHRLIAISMMIALAGLVGVRFWIPR